jgi:hypothetical protein
LYDLIVPPKQVERLTKRIGQERIEQRDAAVAAFAARSLMDNNAVADPERPCPSVAMMSIDRGRLQVRSSPSDSAPHSSHWRESKVAVLETYYRGVFECDPDPHVPQCFLDYSIAW